MELCNYLSNIASLGGLAGEDVWSGNAFEWNFWIVSEQKLIRTMNMSIEKQPEKFKITEFAFKRLPYGNEGIDILRYYHASIYRQYVMEIIFLWSKTS